MAEMIPCFDFIDVQMMFDQFAEECGMSYKNIEAGNELLFECAQRWYIGRVKERLPMSCILESAAAVGQIGDLIQFLHGVITSDTDITPIDTDTLEIPFLNIQTTQHLHPGALVRLRRRTHAEREARTDLPPVS
jgi:hypothetical protein